MLIDAVLVKEERGALRAVTSKADRILRDIFALRRKRRRFNRRARRRGAADRRGRWALVRARPSVDFGKAATGRPPFAAVAAVFIRKTQPEALLPLEKDCKTIQAFASEVRVLDAMLKVNGVKAMARTLGLHKQR